MYDVQVILFPLILSLFMVNVSVSSTTLNKNLSLVRYTYHIVYVGRIFADMHILLELVGNTL